MNRPGNRREFLRNTSAAGLGCLGGVVPVLAGLAGQPSDDHGKKLRAGTAQVDITPQNFPVLVCGGFLSRSASQVSDPLFARCLVLDDGVTKLVLMVVDTIAIPDSIDDEVRGAAAKATGIPADNMMISATHTHTGGSLISALGTKADPEYCALVPGKLVECIEKAAADLKPAKVGWSGEDYPEGTHCRVFIRRPDCIGTDPTGQRNVRAMMHPGYENPQYIGPCGPDDPEVSVLAVQSAGGEPVALLANYSMHYFGAPPISADYFGDFAGIISKTLADGDESFIAMMSHGTSGDQQWQDYANPRKSSSRVHYAQNVADAALRAYERIEFHDNVPLGVTQRRVKIDFQRVEPEIDNWADKVLAEMGGRDPRTREEVYAREIMLLRKMRTASPKLQAIRIGELGIAAMPVEAYAISGLKLKQRCPLADMFNVELANGFLGYIPPPELRPLGGYNCWPARHTMTQNDTETIFVDTLLDMFEELTDREPRPYQLSQGPFAERIVASKPLAYWRLGEIEGRRAWDASGNDHHGTYETGYAFYLDGPNRDDLRAGNERPRAVQFAGGRMKAKVDVPEDYEAEFFFWNGLPSDNRSVTGYLLSLGPDGAANCPGDHLGIAGTAAEKDAAGRLFFFNGNAKNEVLFGGPVIEPKTWYHVRLKRCGENVSVCLDGAERPIISGEISVTRPKGCKDLFVGGRSDGFANLEGRMAEVAIRSV